MKSITSPRRDRGFTLVELLVVIGIIALLISILLPSLNKARRASYELACASNLRQFGLGIQIYCNNNKGCMPQKGPDGSNAGSNFFGPSGGVLGVNDPSLWFNAIPTSTSGKSYYQILLDDQNHRVPLPTPTSANSLFLCPLAGDPATQGANDTIATGSGPAQLRLSRLRPADRVVTMVEKMANAGEYRDKTVQAYQAQYPSVYGSKINSLGLNNNVAQPKSNWKRFTTRHRSGGNLLFADGHVQWFSWTDAQVQPNQMPFNSNTSDANQPNRMIWSIAGPIN